MPNKKQQQQEEDELIGVYNRTALDDFVQHQRELRENVWNELMEYTQGCSNMPSSPRLCIDCLTEYTGDRCPYCQKYE